MKELLELLNKFTDNSDVQDQIINQEVDNFDGDELFSGLPGQFGPSKPVFRPEKERLKIQRAPQEYEKQLLEILGALPKLIETQQILDVQIKQILTQLQDSKNELALMQASPSYFRDEKISVKVSLIESAMNTLGGFEEQKSPAPQKSYTDLTQLQTVILFHYLREHGLVGKEMTNTAMASSVSDLTGFSKEKLRQAFSKIKDESENIDSNFKEADFVKARNALKSVIQSLEDDLKSKF